MRLERFCDDLQHAVALCKPFPANAFAPYVNALKSLLREMKVARPEGGLWARIYPCVGS
jgi:hypothetical protein